MTPDLPLGKVERPPIASDCSLDALDSCWIPDAAYVHVPFCVHRCGYCDFTVVANRDDLIGPFLLGMERELKASLNEPQPVASLFIGGGTPTYLPASDLSRLLKLLSEWLPLKPGGEFSVEANPSGLDIERISVLKANGVNRISLGVQSFHARHLQMLERDHSPEEVAAVVQELQRQGFSNLSLDLIFGVPGQTLLDWRDTLARAVELHPQHISTYGLTFEKGTSFWTRRQQGKLRQAPDELERAMYAAAMDILPQHGFGQYELSNFAQTGFSCRHNQVYWRAEPYFGFGPGAAAFLKQAGEMPANQNGQHGFVRRTNHRSVTTWLKRVLTGESPAMERDELSSTDVAREAVMVGLRQAQGIDLAGFQTRFGCTMASLAPAAWQRFLDLELLEIHEGHVRLTREGKFIADSIIMEFL